MIYSKKVLHDAYKYGLLSDFGDFAVVELRNPHAVIARFNSRKKAYAQIAAGYWKPYGITEPLTVRDMAAPFIWHDLQYLIAHAIIQAYGDIDHAVAVMDKRVRMVKTFEDQKDKAGERYAVLCEALDTLKTIQLL